jgi:hypothetical protein
MQMYEFNAILQFKFYKKMLIKNSAHFFQKKYAEVLIIYISNQSAFLLHFFIIHIGYIVAVSSR